MGGHNHRAARRRIEDLFEMGEGARAASLGGVLAECPSCAAYFEKHAAAEAALCGVSDRATPFALERVKSAVLDSVLRQAAPAPARSRFKLFAFVGSAAAAVAALGIALALALPAGRPDVAKLPSDAALAPLELVARGGEDDGASAVGIRAFRVVAKGGAVDETGPVRIGDTITFTYTHVESEGGYLTLFGVQEGGQLRWYYPGYEGTRSVPIRGDVVDEPLGDGFALGVNHEPGPLRIVALFSKRPLARRAVEEAVETVVAGVESPEALPRLPEHIDGVEVLEHSIFVNIRETFSGMESGR